MRRGGESPETEPVWDHGGGLPLIEGIDASTTLNPFGPSFSLQGLLRENEHKLAYYPDPFSQSVCRCLSEVTGIPAENILPGPGATALLYRLIGSLLPSRLLLPFPIFSEYPKAANTFGIPVCPIEAGGALPGCLWPVDPGFSRTIDQVRKGDLVVLVNPVNPTGEELSREILQDLLIRLDHCGAFLLVDESFQDFIGERSSLLGEVKRGAPGLLILKSFTKRTGIAGLRTGVLFGHEATLDRIRREMGPWATGTLEQEVMKSLLKDPGVFREQCVGIRDRLSQLAALLSLQDRIVITGAGPFLMVRTGWGQNAGTRAQESLLSGVRLRIATGFGPAGGEDWVRVGFQGLLFPHRILSVL